MALKKYKDPLVLCDQVEMNIARVEWCGVTILSHKLSVARLGKFSGLCHISENVAYQGRQIRVSAAPGRLSTACNLCRAHPEAGPTRTPRLGPKHGDGPILDP